MLKILIKFSLLLTVLCADVIIKPATSPLQHSEGPYWDAKRQLLFFVDYYEATILQLNPKSNLVTKVQIPNHNSSTIVIPVKDSNHEFIVTADNFIYKVKWNGQKNDTAIIKQLFGIQKNESHIQYTDGKADSDGRLWIATYKRTVDNLWEKYKGIFYRMQGKLLKEREIIKTGLTLGNGLTWSKDRRRFYYIDSYNYNIQVYDFDLENGEISNPKVLFNLKDYPSLVNTSMNDGLDGMTIDLNDNLWAAVYGGGKIIHVNGTTGNLIRVVHLPVSHPTSVTFGGQNFDILYVTSSRFNFNATQLEMEPLAGSVLELINLGVKGLPANEVDLKENPNYK